MTPTDFLQNVRSTLCCYWLVETCLSAYVLWILPLIRSDKTDLLLWLNLQQL